MKQERHGWGIAGTFVSCYLAAKRTVHFAEVNEKYGDVVAVGHRSGFMMIVCNLDSAEHRIVHLIGTADANGH